MSRRPRTVHEQRVARALRTMAPGGRLASESPVRRPRFTGGAPAVVQTDIWTVFTGGGQLNYGQTNYPDNTIENLGGSDGETYVSLLTCVGVPPLLPSGWTTLVSGSVGDLYYRAGYIQWGPATPQEQIATIDGTTNPPTNQGRMVWDMWYIAGHYTASCSVTTRAGATSHPMQAPSPSWGSTWNMNAYLTPYPAGSSSYTGDTLTLVSYGAGAGYPYLQADMSGAQYGGSGSCTALTATRTSGDAWDSASFAFGLTA